MSAMLSPDDFLSSFICDCKDAISGLKLEVFPVNDW